MAPSSPISLWDGSAAEPAPEAGQPTTGTDQPDLASCDLAIVGGGFTGLSTALHAAQRGLNCHVLEAETVGHGGSGRNVGLVNAGLWLPPQDVHARLGKTRVRRWSISWGGCRPMCST